MCYYFILMSHSPITVIYLQAGFCVFCYVVSSLFGRSSMFPGSSDPDDPSPGTITCFSKESWFLLETKVGAKCDAAAAAAADDDDF